jgi:hypothetical protein
MHSVQPAARGLHPAALSSVLTRIACTGLYCAFVVCAFAAHAQQAELVSAGHASGFDSPWMPDVVQSTNPYLPDPTFNTGHFVFDHFAGPTAGDNSGLVSAALSNGDIVVAGLVAQSGHANPANGLWNIGLVRYNAAGQRVAWSNPGAYGFNSDQYVIYPSDAAPIYQYMRDVKVIGGVIYVMVDTPDPSHSGLGRQNVKIVAFREDGSTLNQGVLGIDVFGAAGIGVDQEDFYGAQIVPIDSTRMIVVATDYDANGPFMAINRLTILGAGGISRDTTWGSYYGDTSNNTIMRYHGSAAATVSYATTAVGFSGLQEFYVAGSVEPQGDSDIYVQKISSATGAFVSSFGNSGTAVIGFDQTGGSHDDFIAGLYVFQNDVYVAAQVAQKCHPGIGLAKLNGTGALNTAFGGSGKIVFGGQGNATPCFSGPVDDVPTSISATGGRIGIAGYHHGGIPSLSNTYDPMLAVVNAVNGSVLDLATHPLTRADGSRRGDAILYDIYGGPNADSPFTVSGNGRDTTLGNTLSFVTGKFVPQGDGIFAYDFECSAAHPCP